MREKNTLFLFMNEYWVKIRNLFGHQISNALNRTYIRKRKSDEPLLIIIYLDHETVFLFLMKNVIKLIRWHKILLK